MEGLLESPEFKMAVSTEPEGVFINNPILSSRISGLFLYKSAPLLSSIEPAFVGDISYYKKLLGLRRYLQVENRIDFVDFEQSLDYLIARHEDRFSNWQRFTVLRHGIKTIEPRDADVLIEGTPAEIKLFRVDR